MKLTGIRTPDTKNGMKPLSVGRGWLLAKAGIVVIGAAMLGGCINVAAPEEPIVIELNINIRQEVIYRLAEDAANTIEENADIF